MTLTIEDLQQLTGPGTVTTARGEEVGPVGQVYLDDDDHRTATWVTVTASGSEDGASFVPLHDARVEGGRIVVPYDRQTIGSAPRVDEDGALSPDEEERLYRHYGIPVAHDAATTEAAGDATMVLSEERLRVGTEVRESGRARLRKHVTTEQVSQTVPLRHEEIRIEREPVPDAERVPGTAQLGEEEHVVVLHEERAVVEKDVVATERVRLAAVTVTEQRTVTAEVRKEEVELEQPERR